MRGKQKKGCQNAAAVDAADDSSLLSLSHSKAVECGKF